MVALEEIKMAIADREGELRQKFQQEQMIEREQLSAARQLLSTDVALIITGVRRCGKSIFALMLGQDQRYAYINFEDERLQLKASELNRVLEAAYVLKGEVDVFIFDEIQNVPGWERFVSRLLPNKKIIITGSNARLLSKELATFLTGRHLDLTLFPFSFREFLVFNNVQLPVTITRDIAQVKSLLPRYLHDGGFPLRYKVGKLFLLETYQDILERDIIQRYRIKHVKVFKDLARYLCSQVASEMSYNQLKNVFKIKSVHTIKNYVSYLQNAYLLFVLERFSFKLKEQMLAPKKIYGIDTGMMNTVGFTVFGNESRIFENAVALELLRRIKSQPEKELFYWKDHQQREVDFIIKERETVRELIQVCYDPTAPSTKEREIAALLRASQELRCRNAIIITFDYEQKEKVNGLTVNYVPLWRWLLEE